MEPQVVFDVFANLTATSTSEKVLHILTGSFRSLSLFLLVFSPLNQTLNLAQRVPETFGPHQYLTTNERRDRVYATTWAQPPSLSSWRIDKPWSAESDFPWAIHHINNVPITATSSYITLPPPFTRLYSTGGPTGEVHKVDSLTGGFAEKLQQFQFVTDEELEKADKTRVALRYGSHAVEVSHSGMAFIPILGTNSIQMFKIEPATGSLNLVAEQVSPREKDGPRHLVISPDSKTLYSVTEHTSFIDVYKIHTSPPSLQHIHSISILPPHLQSSAHLFRGDTLRLAPSTPSTPTPKYLFATTRGAKEDTRGWLSVVPLSRDGLIRGTGEGELKAVERWETPTSGGKANAIELRAKDDDSEGVWIVLTDDSTSSKGSVRILEWNGEDKEGIRVVAEYDGSSAVGDEEALQGASHAAWLD